MSLVWHSNLSWAWNAPTGQTKYATAAHVPFVYRIKFVFLTSIERPFTIQMNEKSRKNVFGKSVSRIEMNIMGIGTGMGVVIDRIYG